MTCLSCHFYVAGLCTQQVRGEKPIPACGLFVYEPGTDEIERAV